MALESASFISGLVSANPPGTDAISQGDDHLRLIKTVLKASLPNADAAINGIHTKATAPSSTSAGQLWFDTTANILKLRNEADDGWISFLSEDGNNIIKVTHFQSTTGVDVRSASFTNVYEFAPVKDSAATDLIIIASVGSDAWNYNTSQTSTYRIYDNDNTAAVGNEYQGIGWQFPGAGDGTGSGGNKGKADVTLIVTESTPLSAGTKTFKIQAKCGNPTDGGISSNNFTVLVLEVPA